MLRMLGVTFGLAVAGLAGIARAQTAPSADAGDDVAIECAGPQRTQVQLDGSGSSDPDGQALTFTWTSASFAGALSGPSPSVVLPLGQHVITLEVADGADGSDTDEVVVTIQDTTPPVLEIGGTPLNLWPPNHSYHDVDVARFVLSVSDTCDESLDADDARFGEVTSDEPENGTGDGDTPDDIVFDDECRELKLRSERKGNGDGRVYEAEILVEDASGNRASAIVDVARVYHAPPQPAVDSGDEFRVAGDCEPEGPGMCPLLPAPSCGGVLPRGHALVRLYEHPRRDDLDSLFFHMGKVDARVADFGDPTSGTEYQLCVYGRESEGSAPFGLIVNPRASSGPAWRALRGGGGFVYRSRRDDDDGLTTILLRARDDGRGGTILVWGFGDDLDMADLPLDEAAGVEVQLHNSLGQCWGAEFPDALRNTSTIFRARSR
jgi:hypothetical protein